MKGNILNSIFFIGLLVFVSGCKPKKLIIAPPVKEETPVVAPDSKKDNLATLVGKDLPFNTLSLKGKARLNVGGNENNVNMLLRVQKDQKIWVSITAIAGIEVARALITPDSVHLRDNLQRRYIKKPFSYIHQFTNKQVNFKLLQSILSGNTVGDFMTIDSDLTQENSVWQINGFKESLDYRVVFNTLLKISEMTLNDAKLAKALKVNYRDYTSVNSSLFPSIVKLNSMAGQKKLELEIEFNKIEVNTAIETPFSAPKSYTLIN